jgi:DNA damage-binding protein 1
VEGSLCCGDLVENDDALENIAGCQRNEGPEISAVSCVPLNTTKRTSPTIVVSYWKSNAIEILQVTPKGLESVYKSPTLPALVRSVLLYNFGSDTNPKGTDYHPYLLAGLANGTVASFRWKDKQLTDKKIIPLGHAPVNLTPCQVEGRHAVFAAGNRATVLSFENKRLVHSPIMLKASHTNVLGEFNINEPQDISSAARLNTPTFASSLILATPTGLFIGRVQGLGKLHIRSVCVDVTCAEFNIEPVVEGSIWI